VFNSIQFYTDNTVLTTAISNSKEVFGENTPYILENRLEGPIVIFNDHFIRTLREALSTGCMAKMSAKEVSLFREFVRYQNGSSYRDITQDSDRILSALNQWVVDLWSCEETPIVNGCFDTTEHTFSTC
jgi:hypothetical protein